jgi:hypothetical protein
MRCIICLETTAPDAFTEEHVFPEAVGGTLVINSVCKPCNDRLGHSVDVTLTDHHLVALKRMAFGLAGKSGKIPNPIERGSLEADPTRKVRFDTTGDVYVLPSVTKVISDGGEGRLSVSVDARDADQLHTIVNKALSRAGAAPVSAEVVRQGTSSVQRTDNPAIKIPFSLDASEYRRGLMKIVYELAWLWLGDGYLDDPVAKTLRTFMFDDTLPFDVSTRYAIQGSMPFGRTKPLFPFWADEPDHLIGCAMAVGSSTGIYVSVLGVAEAVIQVTERADAYPLSLLHFVSINPATGARRDSTYEGEVVRAYDLGFVAG